MEEFAPESKPGTSTEQTESGCSPLTPPTVSGALPPSGERSSWPHVLGICCIVVGVLGILTGLGTIATTFTTRTMVGMMNDPEFTAVMNVNSDSAPILITVNLLKALIALVLVVAGIALVRRRASAPVWALRYSVAQILFALISGIQMALLQRQFMAAALEQDPSMSAEFSVFTNSIALFSAAVAFIWYLLFPLFLLIWFRRTKIKGEIANW